MYEFDKEAYRKRTAWFTEARFGFYIHWGIYAIPGRQNSEWIRSIEQIPGGGIRAVCKGIYGRAL